MKGDIWRHKGISSDSIDHLESGGRPDAIGTILTKCGNPIRGKRWTKLAAGETAKRKCRWCFGE
jgi:hypothetical protein